MYQKLKWPEAIELWTDHFFDESSLIYNMPKKQHGIQFVVPIEHIYQDVKKIKESWKRQN